MDRLEMLLGTWFHSREEDSIGQQIFRPKDFAFPPARGRSGFSLEVGGQAQVLGPGADDRSTARAATWSLSPSGNLIIELPGSDPQNLPILSVSKDKIVIRK